MATSSKLDPSASSIVSRAVVVARQSRGWTFAGLALLVVVGAGLWFFLGDTWFGQPVAEDDARLRSVKEVDKTEPTVGVVQLSAIEIDAAKLSVSPVQRRSLQETHRVPGRIGYNENQYLPITSPVRGVVREVKVLPGQEVQQGDLLAVVSSAEIGIARSDVLLRQEQLELATQRYQWEDQILLNIQSMLDQLQARPEMSVVEKAFAGKLMGDHRSDILTAYAQLRLAESTASRTDPLAQQGVVSGSVVQQRRSDREVAAANFQSKCEETRLACLEQRDRARVDLNDARRRLAVSQEHLSALCGTLAPDTKVNEVALNALQLRAPISGQVTRKTVVPAARVDIADPLFVLADTHSLWVSAQLREQDWETLKTVPGQTVQLQVPAVNDKVFAAKIRFIGAEVSEKTRALPLVAELENSDALLKPGLFAWVAVPFGPARSCVAVPSSAVLRHEDQAFVFVQQRPGTLFSSGRDGGT